VKVAQPGCDASHVDQQQHVILQPAGQKDMPGVFDIKWRPQAVAEGSAMLAAATAAGNVALFEVSTSGQLWQSCNIAKDPFGSR